MYSINENVWKALGAGVNGPVTAINPLLFNTSASETETVIIVNGMFDELLSFDESGPTRTQGIGVWVPSAKNWLSNLNSSKPAFYGQLTSSIRVAGSGLLVAGSLASYGLSASELITFSYDSGFNFGNLGLNDNFAAERSSIGAGLFYTEDGFNLTVLGGKFAVQADDGAQLQNLAFINATDGHEIFEYPSSNDALLIGAGVSTLATNGPILYAGGDFNGTINGQAISGLLCFDLRRNEYQKVQPRGPDPPPNGGGGVKIIAFRPNSYDLWVGGNFFAAGDVDCPGVCIFDSSSNTWRRPGSKLEGEVDFMTWTAEDTLVVAGSVVIDGSAVKIATYYTPDQTWTPFSNQIPISGQITALSPTRDFVQSDSNWSSNAAGFWVAETAERGVSLVKWDGSQWHQLENVFSRFSMIYGMRVFSLAGISANAPNPFLEAHEILLVRGNIELPTVGNVSAAFFNGTMFSPFILTETYSGQPGTLYTMFTEKQAPISRKLGHSCTTPI